MFLILILWSFSSSATFDFDIGVDLNDNAFYTLPILSDPILEYNFISTYQNGSSIDSFVKADIIKGVTSTAWWDTAFRYRTELSQGSNYDADKTYTLILNTQELISSSTLRNDCADMRIYNQEHQPLPFILENCNSENTRLRFKKESPLQTYLYIYHGNPSFTTPNEEYGAYKFFERFENESLFFENWNLISGNLSVEDGMLSSAVSNTTIISSIPTISQQSELRYSFRSSSDSTHKIFLSHSSDTSVRSLSIEFIPSDNVIRYCLIQNSVNECSTRIFEINSGTWHDVHIDITQNELFIYFDGTRVNPVPQYYNVNDAIILFEFRNDVTINEFSVLERATSSFEKTNFNELIETFQGNAFSGNFFFNYNTRALESGQYSITTTASRPNMNTQYASDIFETMYNRISFESSEVGFVNQYSNRHIVDLDGNLEVTNNNPEPVFLNIHFNSPLSIKQIGSGNGLTSNQIQATLGPFSTVSFDYIINGITSSNPLSSNRNVISNSIIGSLNPDLHEIIYSSFTTGEIVVEEEAVPVEVFTPPRKELRYTVDGRYILDSFTRLLLNKYFSSWNVRQGDVVEVVVRISNLDPFSREVRLRDKIPDEFVLYENGRPQETRELEWSFPMNKQTSRVFSYEMKYIGESTGGLEVPRANATSNRLLVFSNRPTLVRKMDSSKQVFVTKKVEPWNVHLYHANDAARISISVVNSGLETIRDIYVDDLHDSGALFVNPSIPTIYNAKWFIEELPPGATWTVTYLTNNYDGVSNLPNVMSFVDDFNVETHLIDELDAVGIWRDDFRSMPFMFLITLIIIIDLVLIGAYAYKYPFFETEEEVTPKLFLDQVMIASRKIFRKQILWFISIKKYFATLFKKLKLVFIEFRSRVFSFFKIFSSKSKQYYSERNVSLVAEKSKGALSFMRAEVRELKELSLKDWVKLFIHYKNKFFEMLRNRITYSMYLTSGKMLSRNPNSKTGRILSFSSKVINPDLKGYLTQLINDKMQKKELRYKKEIESLERLRKENRNIDSENGFLKKLLLRIKYFFKK